MKTPQFTYDIQPLEMREGKKVLSGEDYYGFETDVLPRVDDSISFCDNNGEHHIIRVSQILHPYQKANSVGNKSKWEKQDRPYIVRGIEVKLEDSIW